MQDPNEKSLEASSEKRTEPIDDLARYRAEIEYLESLHWHKFYVFEAGLRIGGLPVIQLAAHDLSKFSPEEFPYYARHFHGGGDPDGFARAWKHHIGHNPHHPEYWIFSDGYTPQGSRDVINGIIPMPEIYVREMVADWWGASRAYTGSWDMSDWLTKNLPRIEKKLHPYSIDHLADVLAKIGYIDLVHQMNWPVR